MSLFFRSAEQRSVTASDVPWSHGGDPVESVSERKALGLVPVFAAVRHITDFSSTLPLHAYRKAGEERIRTPLPQLFRTLQSTGELSAWLCQGMSSMVIHGNAVGWIVARDGMGFPTNVVWLERSDYDVDDSSGRSVWYVKGRKVSRIDLVHIPWISVAGRTLGLSPIEYYAATVQSGRLAQQFGNDWFAGGGFPPAVFRNTARTVDPAQVSTIRARLQASIRRHEPLVTGNDWEYTPITIPPEQAQFIESQKLSANQVAAIYGIEPDEVGGEAANSLTYSNEESRQIKRAANLRPYLTRFEWAFASWLPERQFVSFTTDAPIRIDTKTRHEVYKIQREIGLRSINEQRALEDLPPVPGGDVYAPSGVQTQPSEGIRRLSAVPDERTHYE